MGGPSGSTTSSQDRCSSPETASVGTSQTHKERKETSRLEPHVRAKSEDNAHLELHSELSRRPLGGKSKENLMHQIALLQEEHSALLLQIRTILRGRDKKHQRSVEASVGRHVDVQQYKRSLLNPTEDCRSVSSTTQDGADFPSTFASQDENETEYLEEIVSLAGALRKVLLSGNTGHTENDRVLDLLKIAGLRELLTDATPHPERADAYAQSFAKRR